MRAFERSSTGRMAAAAGVFLFAASAITAAPPVTIQQKVQKTSFVVPPDVAERLRKAGLDANDPNLAARLKALATKTSPIYVRSLTQPRTAVRLTSVVGKVARNLPHLAVPATTLVTGQITRIADHTHNQLVSIPNPVLYANGQELLFLVQTPKSVAVDPPPDATGDYHGTVSYKVACGVFDVGATAGYVFAEYLVATNLDSLPIGRTSPGTITIRFANVTAQIAATLVPETLTVAIDATVDHTPAFSGTPSVSPWGPTGISGMNASLGSAGFARVGGGDYLIQTQGDDLVGVGLQVDPGWKVASTAIKSASSATAPEILVPDNIWRGAAVTQGPQGGDLRTFVHWHYSGIDSLDYTLEWTLTGPAGQRPMRSMAKSGNCDIPEARGRLAYA